MNFALSCPYYALVIPGLELAASSGGRKTLSSLLAGSTHLGEKCAIRMSSARL